MPVLESIISVSFLEDRNKILISGGVSVVLHMVSPLSRDLFHRAIVMSGSVLPQTRSPMSQPNLIKKLAMLLGCNHTENSFDCVKRSDARNITDQLRNIFEFGWDNPVYPWLPIVEPKVDAEEPFLDDDPMKLLQAGKFRRIPIMVTTTKDEISMSAMYLLQHRNLLQDWLSDFSRIGPICVQYEANETITDALKIRYVTDELNDMTNYSALFSRTAEVRNDFKTHAKYDRIYINIIPKDEIGSLGSCPENVTAAIRRKDFFRHSSSSRTL